MERSITKLRGKVKVTKPIKKKESVPATPRIKKETIGNLSLEETRELRELEFADGMPLLTKQVTYEVLALIKEQGFNAAYEFLTSKSWEEEKELILALPNLHNARERAQRDVVLSQEKIKAITGTHRCTNCGSSRTVTVEKQIRSCDEPTTQIVTCTDCGYKKRYG